MGADARCVNAHDRCFGGAGGPCPYCEPAAPTVAAQQCGLDEKALEVGYDLPWALEEFTRNGQRCANIVSNDGTIVCEIRGILDACGNRENGELIVRAVNSLGALSALPSSPVSELVERLRTDSKGEGNFVAIVPLHSLRHEAADRLTALEVENARLRRALEFYADVSKYPAPFTGGMGALWSDCGQIALAALSTAPQGGDHAEG